MKKDPKNDLIQDETWPNDPSLTRLLRSQEVPPPSPGFTKRLLNQIDHASNLGREAPFHLRDWFKFWRRPNLALGFALSLILGFSFGFLQFQENAVTADNEEESPVLELAAFDDEENDSWIWEE